MSQLVLTGRSFTGFSDNSNYAAAFLRPEGLILQPISEIYAIKPDFEYINEQNEADLASYEIGVVSPNVQVGKSGGNSKNNV